MVECKESILTSNRKFLWLLTFYQTGPNGLFIFYQLFNLILQSAEKKFDSTLNKESFHKIINNSFKSDDIVGISGDEIFKRIIYDHSEYLQDDFVIENMSSLLVRQGIST